MILPFFHIPMNFPMISPLFPMMFMIVLFWMPMKSFHYRKHGGPMAAGSPVKLQPSSSWGKARQHRPVVQGSLPAWQVLMFTKEYRRGTQPRILFIYLYIYIDMYTQKKIIYIYMLIHDIIK